MCIVMRPIQLVNEVNIGFRSDKSEKFVQNLTLKQMSMIPFAACSEDAPIFSLANVNHFHIVLGAFKLILHFFRRFTILQHIW